MLPPTLEPLEGIAAKALHDPSGTGVLPWRANIESDVPAGVVAVHVAAPQLAFAPPSNTRDV